MAPQRIQILGYSEVTIFECPTAPWNQWLRIVRILSWPRLGPRATTRQAALGLRAPRNAQDADAALYATMLGWRGLTLAEHFASNDAGKSVIQSRGISSA